VPKKQPTETWKAEPEEHDFPAAQAYLSLLFPEAVVTPLVERLRAAGTVYHQAKDLLRASGLRLLPGDNAHVASDLSKVQRGERLSPVLLVRGDGASGLALIVADGYHRICASYRLNENADIPCRLVDRAP
jgi:hypothetical protein